NFNGALSCELEFKVNAKKTKRKIVPTTFSPYYLLGRIFLHKVHNVLPSCDTSKKDIAFPATIAGNTIETACLILENKLQRKLDFPFRRGRFEKNARRSSDAGRQGSSRCVKDVGIAVTGAWRSKV